MGHGRWSSDDWDSYSSRTTKGKSRAEIFNQRSLKQNMDPRGITFRESRDSVDNPHSTPVILALDVTGSMGMIAEQIAREGLAVLIENILARKPVTDPHIMLMGVGDVYCDRAPLQVSQFEADIRIAEQLKDIFLEGGGGGNNHESYTLPWYFAAQKTDIDSIKSGRKGLLFTFGDEECPPELRAEQIKAVLGDKVAKNLSAKDLLDMVSQKYDVYHVVVEEGNYARTRKQQVYQSWEAILPKERIIPLKDYKSLPEVVVSVMEVHAGKTKAEVVASWQDAQKAKAVADAIQNVIVGGAKPLVSLPLAPFKVKKAAGKTP
jgi:hypothetical protein